MMTKRIIKLFSAVKKDLADDASLSFSVSISIDDAKVVATISIGTWSKALEGRGFLSILFLLIAWQVMMLKSN